MSADPRDATPEEETMIAHTLSQRDRIDQIERELAIAEKMATDANEAYNQAHVSMVEALDQLATEKSAREKAEEERDGFSAMLAAEKALADQIGAQLKIAEAALSDIGDAEREDGDDLKWCERMAAKAIPSTRAALDAYRKARGL